jgi:hypothetical protein
LIATLFDVSVVVRDCVPAERRSAVSAELDEKLAAALDQVTPE